jgi:hypothetical protein
MTNERLDRERERTAELQRIDLLVAATVQKRRQDERRERYALAVLTALLAKEEMPASYAHMNALILMAESFRAADALIAVNEGAADKDPDDCAPTLDHGQAPDRGGGT